MFRRKKFHENIELEKLTFDRGKAIFKPVVQIKRATERDKRFEKFVRSTTTNQETSSLTHEEKSKIAAVIDADRSKSSNRRPVVRRVAPSAELARWRRPPRAKRRSRVALSSPRPRTPEKSRGKDHEKATTSVVIVGLALVGLRRG